MTECLWFFAVHLHCSFFLGSQIRKTTPPNVGIRGGGGLCTESCNQYPLPSYPMSHAHSRHFQFPAPFSRFPGRFTILPSAYFPHPSRQKKKKSFGEELPPIAGLLTTHSRGLGETNSKLNVTVQSGCKVHGCKVFSDARSIFGRYQSKSPLLGL